MQKFFLQSKLKSSLKKIATNWLPPAAFQVIKKIIPSDAVRFDGPYRNWTVAKKNSIGYADPAIFEKVKTARLKVENGEAIYERDSVLFDKIEYSWPVLSSLMWVAAREGGRLNVLDFGGALGSSYFQNKKFLSKIPQMSWNVIEQPHFVDWARENIQTEQLRFFRSVDECLIENRPNIVLFSAVLHYLEFPHAIIKKLAQQKINYILIDRTPFSKLKKDIAIIQHVPKKIYKASYPLWVFSEEHFIDTLKDSYSIIECFDSLDGKYKIARGCEFIFKGLLAEINSPNH